MIWFDFFSHFLDETLFIKLNFLYLFCAYFTAAAVKGEVTCKQANWRLERSFCFVSLVSTVSDKKLVSFYFPVASSHHHQSHPCWMIKHVPSNSIDIPSPWFLCAFLFHMGGVWIVLCSINYSSLVSHSTHHLLSWVHFYLSWCYFWFVTFCVVMHYACECL